MLMEHFAAELWRSGKRSWSVYEVEQWLIDFLAANPRIAGHYEGKDRELLKEDLRTATFVLRPDTEEKHFRFAHTSLQEFFLASYLVRALREAQRLTQRQLASRAGVGPRAVWDLERGKPTIRLDVVNRVLAVFGRRVSAAVLEPSSGAW